MSETLERLVLVRHGQSEGDVRRENWRRGETSAATKLPEEEELTAEGAKQCRQAGLWIQKYMVGAYGTAFFDGYFVSPALRCEQSAGALNLTDAIWQEESSLDERDRGQIRGLHPDRHRQMHPDSFDQMRRDPLHWHPPGGEQLLPGVTDRVGQFLGHIEGARSVIAVTHRDWMWMAQLALEQLTEAELLAVDTDRIGNGQIVEYTSLNPATGEQAPVLLWKRSVGPAADAPGEWQLLPRLAEQYPSAA